MAFPGRPRHRLNVLLRSERGMALPTALFAMIASFAMATAAVLSSVNAQTGTKRDSDSKSAIAAADAGAGVALLRLNRFGTDLSATKPCVGPGGETQTPSGGWCPATSAESVGEATFSYRISAFEEDVPLSVISVGTADGVSRRVEVGLISYSGENVFADENLVGQDSITLEGTPDIRTDIGTNGDVINEGTGTICGNIRHGNGKSAPDPDCDGEVDEGNRDLPELKAPENIATENTNCRLDLTCPNPETELDPYSKKRSSTNPWDPVTRTINVSSNATLTMGGKDYFVCGLYVDNGELIMAAGSNVRIFFDTPENCGLADGDVQIHVAGNGNIKSTGYNPDEGKFDVIGLYVLGSETITTKIQLTGGSDTNELVLYAPHSDVDIGGNASWVGMLAGKSMKIHGTPEIVSDPGISSPDIFFSSLWERTHYVECTGASATPPDANC